MLRAYKYRIYPTEEQKVLLAKTFGCCRYVYNWCLEEKERAYKDEGRALSKWDMQKMVRSMYKGELPWLKEVSSEALMFAIADLFDGYDRFFKGISKHPTPRKKHYRQSYHDRASSPTAIKVDFKRGMVTIPKIKDIPCVFHRRFSGHIKQVSVELLTSGRYHLSVLVEDGQKMPKKAPVDPDKTIGIDMGFMHLATLSDGQVFEASHCAKKLARKQKLLDRRIAKTEKGSRQFRTLKRRLGKLHQHIKSQRRDYIHKITHYLAYESQATTVCVENLNMEGIMRNKYLAYSARDACIGEFFRQLNYKCAWAGKNLVKIDRWAPSSKMCSHCGYVYKTLNMDEREWTCPECDTHHDRDLNAAINIKHFGLSEQQTLPPVRRKVKLVEKATVDDRSSEPKKQSLVEAGKVTGKRAQMPES